MLEITPQTKVGELLDTYPELEKKLLELSPKFEHLKNPILRKTVAKIATLQQAAQIAGLAIEELVNALRKEANQDQIQLEAQNNINPTKPLWLEDCKIYSEIDIRPLIDSGEHPIGQVLKLLDKMPKGEVLIVMAPFFPSPLATIAKEKGYELFYMDNPDSSVSTYFFKP
ncbi:MAG: DUF1858 domain-containing protein [Bacteroidales bacterium]|nr:DUF1858 domain-containing protein [Bacteroidales bacterium]